MNKPTALDLMPGLRVDKRPTLVDLKGNPLGSPDKSEEDYEADELNLVSMIDDLLARGNMVPPDLRIDDRDFPEFPNFYEFCFSKKGMDQAPFARQLAIATHLLAEWCPRCTTPAFRDITRIPVDFKAKDFPDKVQFLHYGQCPRCKATKSELYAAGELHIYTELAACLGQRAGKSAMLGLIGPYLIHKWLKLQKPVQALGLMKNSILVGTFVGLTFQKAIELLWQPISNAITDSPWFQGYHQMLDTYGEQYDQEFYKFKDTFLNYYHRNLFLSPSGPNKRTLRGATRFMTFIDELGWFPHGEENDQMERASANEVYVSLDRSLKTVRKSAMIRLRQGWDNIPMAYMCSISSPSSYMDKIMSLVRTHEGSEEVYTAHLATWEVNPLYTKKDFAKEYRDDPIKAERDFGAQPPMSENPWIGDMDVIKAAMTGKKLRVAYQYKHRKSNSGQKQRYAEILSVFPPQPCPVTVMSLDQGYSNNSLGISIAHPSPSGNGARVLAVIEIAPTRGQAVLNYTQIAREVLYPLIEAFNVRLVAADRWESLKLLSDIEDEYPNCQTVQYSLKAEDFGYIRDCLIDDREQLIELPKPEIKIEDIANVDLEEYPHCFRYQPAAHLFHQFMTVSENARGIVDKGAGYTDDILRAVCVGLSYCLDEDAIEQYELRGAATTTRPTGPVGVKTGKAVTVCGIGARSNGGGGLGSGGGGSMGRRG